MIEFLMTSEHNKPALWVEITISYGGKLRQALIVFGLLHL